VNQLSPHFSLAELTVSDLASRRGIDNTPPMLVVVNLRNLALGLEQVREILQVPIIITSGYRSPAVNRAVGGSAVSAHCDGWAADFIAPLFGTPLQVAKAIRDSKIAFDQLIAEGSWTHLSFRPPMRRQVLTAHFHGGPATYTEGLA
jgi:zinc D-Ala-D-Ala carboxypeptidase